MNSRTCRCLLVFCCCRHPSPISSSIFFAFFPALLAAFLRRGVAFFLASARAALFAAAGFFIHCGVSAALCFLSLRCLIFVTFGDVCSAFRFCLLVYLPLSPFGLYGLS